MCRLPFNCANRFVSYDKGAVVAIVSYVLLYIIWCGLGDLINRVKEIDSVSIESVNRFVDGFAPMCGKKLCNDPLIVRKTGIWTRGSRMDQFCCGGDLACTGCNRFR